MTQETQAARAFIDHWNKAEFGLSAKDTGIDLVAKTQGTDEYHAIQCKCYAEDYRVRKADIDSFFTASGQKPFTHRYVVTTNNDWSDNAEQSLGQQQIPAQKIDLSALETSQIDWAKGEIDSLKTPEERNRMGQFATPYPLALEIAGYTKSLLNANHLPPRFADPSIGSEISQVVNCAVKAAFTVGGSIKSNQKNSAEFPPDH